MAAGDLTTVNNALAWLGMQADDGTVARLVTALSSQIQKTVSYQFASASYTRAFNGRGGRALMLPDRPLTAVSSLMIDDQVVPLSTSTTTDGFVFDDKSIFLRGCYEFCRGVQNVVVTYTAGYATVPGDVEQACLDWIKIVHDRIDTLPGVKSFAAGDTKIEYDDAITKLGSGALLMPPVIAAALQQYQRVAPV